MIATARGVHGVHATAKEGPARCPHRVLVGRNVLRTHNRATLRAVSLERHLCLADACLGCTSAPLGRGGAEKSLEAVADAANADRQRRADGP